MPQLQDADHLALRTAPHDLAARLVVERGVILRRLEDAVAVLGVACSEVPAGHATVSDDPLHFVHAGRGDVAGDVPGHEHARLDVALILDHRLRRRDVVAVAALWHGLLGHAHGVTRARIPADVHPPFLVPQRVPRRLHGLRLEPLDGQVVVQHALSDERLSLALVVAVHAAR